MKSASFRWLLFFTISFIISCKHKDQHQDPPNLSTDKTAITHTRTSGTESLTITSNIYWSITVPSTASWLKIDKTSGSKGTTTVTLTFPENKSATPLVTDLILSGSGVSDQKIHIVQEGSAPFINVDKTAVVIKPTDIRDSLLITSNTEWKLDIPASSTWLSVDKTTGGAGAIRVHFSMTANTSVDTLRTELSLSSPGQTSIPTIPIKVQHDGGQAVISLDKTTLTEKAAGQQDSIVLTANTDWTLSFPASVGWVRANKTSGNAGNTKVYFTIDKNSSPVSRTATLTVSNPYSSASTQTVTIKQDAGFAISGFSPLKGQPGTAVTINGNFGTSATLPSVSLNGAPATVTASTATSINILIPSGTTGGKITVTIGDETCISDTEFTVTNTLVHIADGSGLSFKDNISFVYGDKIYVGLGTTTTGTFVNNFKIFNTTTSAWSAGPIIPAAMSTRKEAICFVLDNKAYIGMGRSSTSELKDWWRFDPSNNTWTQLTNYPVTGYSGACFVIKDTAYVIGAPFTDYGNIYQFDPAANSGLGKWNIKKNMVLPAISTTSFSIGDYGYIIGGDTGIELYNEVNRYLPSSGEFKIFGQDPTPPLNDVPHLVINFKGYLFYTKATFNTIYLYDPVIDKLIDLQTPLPDNFTGQYNSAVVNGSGYIWTNSGKVYKYLP